jgi:2-polyprenyl-3-methyl-5-hydroxy-6-metoxy-1,4-benzoquinol methylase
VTAPAHAYFDAMYGANDDPYGLRTRWYEERKRNLLLAALPARRYANACEPGCGVGELTLALASRCDRLFASDLSQQAVAIARRRCAAMDHVRVERRDLPAEWPDAAGPFDLIVLSEMGYFLEADAMHALAACCIRSLGGEGTIVACDWRPDFAERALPTDEVHAAIDALGLARIVRHEEDDFVLQVWSRDARSVAQREGIR